MRKGIVMEKGSDHVIVMTKDARFVKLNTKKHAAIGEEIYFFEEDLAIKRRPIGRAAIAAVLAFFLILASVPFIGPYLTPVYAIVSVDINPSLELFLDQQEKVIRYRAFNERARDVLSRDLVGDSIEEALEQILERVEALDYKETDTPVLIGFTSEHEQFREQLSEHLTVFATENEEYRFALIGTSDVPDAKGNSLGKTVLKINGNEEIETLETPDLKRINHGLPQPAVENRERVEEQKSLRDAEKAEREVERLAEKKERKEEQEQFVEEKKEAARRKADAARGKGLKEQDDQEGPKGPKGPKVEEETQDDEIGETDPGEEASTPPGQREKENNGSEAADEDSGDDEEEPEDEDENDNENKSEEKDPSEEESSWERNRYQFRQ